MFEKKNLAIILLWLVCLAPSLPAAAQRIVDGKNGANGLETSSSEEPPANAVRPDAAPREASKTAADTGGNNKMAATPRYALKRGDREIVLEIGSSPFNPSNFAGPKEYDVYGRDLHLASLRFGRVFGVRGPVAYEYLFGVTPLAVFTKNEVRNPAYRSAQETPGVAPTVRQTTWGVGVQPLNFRFIFRHRHRYKPFAEVGAGIMLTSRSMPVPRGTAFNLTGDFGGGVQFFTSESRAVSIGYKYFHLSNGNIGGKINNPGYNANVFYVSYSFFHRKK
ncbi:MAG: acyloxyacyl hydrolase [Acidobacteria bacterium]|nr:acyloxyacyl hydrolase [Acidobacteriota bacterium]